MEIKYFDYNARISNDHDLIKTIIQEVAISGDFILKKHVEAFEKTIAEKAETKYAIATSNGSTALLLSLKALGVGRNDEVLTPAHSFAASANAIAACGATPVFVDVDISSGTMDVEDARKKITPHTRAVLPVHLHSDQADMKNICRLAHDNGLQVLEDSAVCFGARQEGKTCGSLGDIGVFSFFPIKPAGGIGEAGVIVTDNDELARTCRWLRNHGQDGKTRFLHHLIGFNARMDDIVASYLLHRFERLDGEFKRRREIAQKYLSAFSHLSQQIDLPQDLGADQLWYTFVLRSDAREELAQHLKERGIGTHIHYPNPLPMHSAYSGAGHVESDFPNSDNWSRRSLALPLQPELADSAIDMVINGVLAFYK